MKAPGKEQIERLPKWAQDHISHLCNQIRDLRSLQNDWQDEPSDFCIRRTLLSEGFRHVYMPMRATDAYAIGLESASREAITAQAALDHRVTMRVSTEDMTIKVLPGAANCVNVKASD